MTPLGQTRLLAAVVAISALALAGCASFVDARTDKLLWRGWAKGRMEGVVDHQEWMEQRIDDGVRRILDRLPRRL